MNVNNGCDRPNDSKQFANHSKVWNTLKVLRGLVVIFSGFLLLVGMIGWAAGGGYPASKVPDQPGGASVTLSVDDVEEGDTQLFWAFAQGFFQGYYAVSATCQLIGEYAYLYTEDARINDLLCSPDPSSQTIFAATTTGLYKSLDAGSTWSASIGGLPDMDGTYDDFDEDNYNRRANVYKIFSLAESGGSFDTLWAATEFGPFLSTAAGDTFKLRASKMAIDSADTEDKPACYDILGHPTETKTVWAATIDGVYQTRNANRWKRLSHGLPPGEGSIWYSEPVYALSYYDDYLFATTSKGTFYGQIRPLAESATADVVTAWKPLGGTVEFELDTTHTTTADELWLIIESQTSLGYTITAGQQVTFIDPEDEIYWAGFVDETPAGLTVTLRNADIFYYPDGDTPPEFDYTNFDLDALTVYGYNPMTGPALFVESDGESDRKCKSNRICNSTMLCDGYVTCCKKIKSKHPIVCSFSTYNTTRNQINDWIQSKQR